MCAFMTKKLCVVTHVLDIRDCPPHDVVHLVETYPLYYDALYFPELHLTIYASSHGFCSWLHSALSSHLRHCQTCILFPSELSVTFEDATFCVKLGGEQRFFHHQHFECETYTHCTVFQAFSVDLPKAPTAV